MKTIKTFLASFSIVLMAASCLPGDEPISAAYVITNKSGHPVTNLFIVYTGHTIERIENEETITYNFTHDPMHYGDHIDYYINGKKYNGLNERDAEWGNEPDVRFSHKVIVDGCRAIVTIYQDEYTIEIEK
jgi:hypothetical protein